MGLTQGELDGFKTAIEQAARPLVLYDDDADGLASFLLVYRANSSAIGVRVARGPEVTVDFSRRVLENIPDLVVILDKPRVDKEFFSIVRTPTIWLDHHGLDAQKPHEWKFPHLTYLNPRLHDVSDGRPTAFWVYESLGGPLWIAAVGVTSDWDDTLLGVFRDSYPSLAPPTDSIDDALFASSLGVIIHMFNFCLKGKAGSVNKAISALKHVDDPVELLEGSTSRGRFVKKHYDPLRKEYDEQLHEVMSAPIVDGALVYVFGHVRTSFVTHIANEVLSRSSAIIVIVGRREAGKVRFSIRSLEHDLQPHLLRALEGIDGHGGGHMHACGGSVVEESWELLRDKLLSSLRSEL